MFKDIKEETKKFMRENYSTHETTELLEISKSTLFRWERLGLIPRPGRNANDERVYSRKEIETIASKKLVRINHLLGNSKSEELLDAQLRLSFILDPIKTIEILYPHVNKNKLHERTVRILLEHATQLRPGNDLRIKIFKILIKNEVIWH